MLRRMPRSVIVLSEDPNLFESVRALVRLDGRFIDGRDRLHCDGTSAPLANIYPTEMVSVEWDNWESTDPQMPDPRSMSALIFECRLAGWIAEVGRLLAEGLETRVWFVDAMDTAWPADQVDPNRIALVCTRSCAAVRSWPGPVTPLTTEERAANLAESDTSSTTGAYPGSRGIGERSRNRWAGPGCCLRAGGQLQV